MEDWMYIHSMWKLQIVCLYPHPIFDLEGAYKLEVELFVQSPCLEVAAQESHYIPNIEHLRFCFPVHVDGLGVVCMDPLHFDISAHCDHSFSPFLGSWDVSIYLFDKSLLDHQIHALECVEW